jgi:hypothetical protein
MKAVSNTRHLASHERTIAFSVFHGTIPYDQVIISDGLGGGDRPFTLPTSVPVSVFFNVRGGKYVIHAGDGYYGMSNLQEDKKTLIHELTHVWQGEHGSHSWSYVLDSLWHQTLSDDAYEYDKRDLKEWDDYGAEQQAQIVEDWFADGMSTDKDVDLRFYYIKKYIRGEKLDRNWIRESWIPKPLPTSTLKVPPLYPNVDSYLLPILAQRFAANDVAGFGARAKKVEEIFARLESYEVPALLARLTIRRTGDKLSEYFHDHLSTPTRTKLLGILRSR